MKSNTRIPLKIAGTGPLSKELKELTKNDSRIELLGFVSDDDLITYYSSAYAFLFVPYDEDYGLVTIEAMMCEKPVLTFTDTGGVVEFVKDQVTGLICSPSTSELAKNIDFISNNLELCKKMGKEAKKRVKSITWGNTIGSLLNESFDNTTGPIKLQKKITVVTTYPVYPPRGGGQNRIFYLYKELAKSMIVDIVCLVHESEKYKKSEIGPNLFEIRVPKTQEHANKEWRIEDAAGIPITDIAMLFLYDETPQFIEEIKKSSTNSKFIIISQPYTYPLLKKNIDLPIIHDSQNVEYNLKKQMLKDTAHNRKLLEKLFEVEKESCQEAIYTTVCAYDDAVVFEDLYDLDKTKAIVVANGVDLQSVPYVSQEKRRKIQRSLGLENQKTVLFIGSWHQPNIDAVEVIFNIATKLPHYNFVIMGSVGGYFATHGKPKNVGFTGITDDVEKEMYLSVVDVAINPMLTGSGTNLKMLDYMANGIPVISTEVGVRGLNIPSGYIVVCDTKKFDESILNIDKAVQIKKSRAYVEDNFSWEKIGAEYKSFLYEIRTAKDL
jgi:glycosyltransferase involved in cell wall biosynthesis